MSETPHTGKIEYQIQIGEFAAQEAWDSVLDRLRERVPNLCAFIERERNEHAEFLIPRTFDLDQAMRLREVLASCGLNVSVVPAMGDSVAISEPNQPSYAERTQTLDPIRSWSHFLTFGPFPEHLAGSQALLLGLGFRVLAGLLAVPAWHALAPTLAAGSISEVLLVASVSFLTDISILWLGMRLFVPRAARSATAIESAVAPTFLLDAIPIVGFFVGSVWRIGLRTQAILTATAEPIKKPGAVIYAVLVPWLAFGALLTLLASLVLLAVYSRMAMPTSALPF